MFRLLLTILLFSLVLCDTNEERNGRIIQAQNAVLGQFQSVVSLRRVNTLTHIGGGALINIQWVLTAASITTQFARPTDLAVALGITNTATAVVSPGMVVVGQQIINHANFVWNAEGYPFNDISLVRIQSVGCATVRFGVISSIWLEPRIIADPSGATVIGWGSRTQDKAPNTLLGFAPVNLAEGGCEGTGLGGNAICTDSIICNTDVGSPLITASGLIGIASLASCGHATFPDTYTRISAYRTWITINSGI